MLRKCIRPLIGKLDQYLHPGLKEVWIEEFYNIIADRVEEYASNTVVMTVVAVIASELFLWFLYSSVVAIAKLLGK